MGFSSEHFYLILALEGMALLLVIILVLVIRLKKFRHHLQRLKNKLTEARQALTKAKEVSDAAPPTPPATPLVNYQELIEEQISATRDYHRGLDTPPDIALDLDPEAPIARRTAAMRHAFLIAEKAANADRESGINWDLLASRYQQLISFHQDYAVTEEQSEELAEIKEELAQAHKRIGNLERFKTLYFELEERWSECKGQADEHYSELRNLIANSDQPPEFEELLSAYLNSYEDLGNLIQSGAEIIHNKPTDVNVAELKRLRNVAADQHRIITELQEKLASADSQQEQITLISNLQQELTKQSRFLQESETCIKLMEDELNNANLELAQLRKKTQQIPELTLLIQELHESAESTEQLLDTLKSENRKLVSQLKASQKAPPEDNEELLKTRKELISLQAKYNDLEERFLDLKMKG